MDLGWGIGCGRSGKGIHMRYGSIGTTVTRLLSFSSSSSSSISSSASEFRGRGTRTITTMYHRICPLGPLREGRVDRTIRLVGPNRHLPQHLEIARRPLGRRIERRRGPTIALRPISHPVIHVMAKTNRMSNCDSKTTGGYECGARGHVSTFHK